MTQLPAKIERRSTACLLAGLVATLCAATALAFWPVLSLGFVNFDDPQNVVDNHGFRGFSPARLHWMATSEHMGHYHPLTWLSYAVDYSLGGCEADGTPRPASFHRTNLLLHLVNAAGVMWLFLVFQSTTRASREECTPQPSSIATGDVVGAFAAGALFALHPQRVESVAWVTERRDLLSTAFLLLTMIAWLHSFPSKTPRRMRLIALACYAASLLSKAWGITLPVVLLLTELYRLWPLRNGRVPASDSESDPAVNSSVERRSEWIAALRPVVQRIAPFALLAIPFAYWAAQAQQSSGAWISWQERPLLLRLGTALYAVAWYPVRTLFPVAMHPAYELPAKLSLHRFELTAAGLCITAAMLGLWRIRSVGLWIAAAAYVTIASPILGLTQSGPQWVADRYGYVALIPCWLATGWGVSTIWRSSGSAMESWKRWTMAAALGAICLFLGIATTRQCAIWRDSDALWRHVLLMEPKNVLALANLGGTLLERGDFDGAAPFLKSAVEAASQTGQTTWQLRAMAFQANAAERQGDVPSAVEIAQQMLAVNRGDIQATLILSSLWLKRPETFDNAEKLLRECAELHPFDPAIVNQLAAVMISRNKSQAAVELLKRALGARPRVASLWFHLGLATAALGDRAAAKSAYVRCLELDDRFAAAHNNLGNQWMDDKAPEAAIPHLEAAIALQPDRHRTRLRLAQALFAARRPDAALMRLEEIVAGCDDPSLVDLAKKLISQTGRPRESKD